MDLKALHKVYFTGKDYLMIIIGTLMYGFSFNGFILNNEIITGGLSGICALIYFATSIPVSFSYFTFNVILLLIAYKILGIKFLIKTIFGIICLFISLTLFEWLFQGNPILADEPFMSIIIGAGICGAGLGLIFTVNGSTGGTDIIAAIVNKHKPISIGRALLFCDFIIISCSYILFHDVEKIVFGFVEMVISNHILDMVINSNRQSVQFLIFSRKHEEIVEVIIKDLDRGCTILDGIGGYSKEQIKVVVLLVKKSESITIFRLVKQIDSQAFISQSNVRGVYGEGFDVLKT
ncbi:MAG: YitT family protein [Tannerellaceae bacterium]|nr:YitT family protein [Tannerellaceae bacterium]